MEEQTILECKFKHQVPVKRWLGPSLRRGQENTSVDALTHRSVLTFRSKAESKNATPRPKSWPQDPWTLSATAWRFTCPRFNFEKSPVRNVKRFGSQDFRENWGWPCAAVRMWLICSNRKLCHKKRSFCCRETIQQSFFVIDSLTIFMSAQIVHSHMYWGKICLRQGFSNGALGPPWGPRSGSLGTTSRGFHYVALPWYCITQVHDILSICQWNEEGGHGSWKFENYWSTLSRRSKRTPWGL